MEEDEWEKLFKQATGINNIGEAVDTLILKELDPSRRHLLGLCGDLGDKEELEFYNALDGAEIWSSSREWGNKILHLIRFPDFPQLSRYLLKENIYLGEIKMHEVYEQAVCKLGQKDAEGLINQELPWIRIEDSSLGREEKLALLDILIWPGVESRIHYWAGKDKEETWTFSSLTPDWIDYMSSMREEEFRKAYMRGYFDESPRLKEEIYKSLKEAEGVYCYYI